VAAGDAHKRRALTEVALRRKQTVVDLAWRDLPPDHRLLLQNIGADERQVVDTPLGRYADDLLRSAGHTHLEAREQARLDEALGVWVAALNVVLIDAGHHQHAGLDDRTYEGALVRVAWHEWAHALGVVRATADDVAEGPRLLDRAPSGVREGIRCGGYRRRDYTHELIAETYALLMARRRRGQTGQPPWLDDAIYELVRRVCGWSQ